MEALNNLMDYYKNNIRIDSNNAWDIICNFKKAFEKDNKLSDNEIYDIMKCFHERIIGKHFIEPYALYQVSKMYHTDAKGNKIYTPLFNIDDAKKVYDKYVKQLNKGYTCWDVYVALNAQYHDNINLYNKWFPNCTNDEIENKIIQAAIVNWFEDEDGSSNKIWEYFKMK